MNRFLDELKRRNVIRMAGLYLVGAWLLVQVAGTVLPMFGAPDWIARSIVILLAIGFVPALIFSWVFELTPQGLKRDEDVTPEESIAPQTARRMNRMIIAVLVLALGYFAVDKFVLAPRRAAAPNDSPSGASVKSIAVLPFEKRLSNERYVSAYTFALVYLGLGDREEALRWLERSYENRAGYEIGYIKVDHFLDPLRRDPRFEGLAQRIFGSKAEETR